MHRGCRWAESDHPRRSLYPIVRELPRLVAGKCVVVTSVDSGPLRVGTELAAAGWIQRGDLALLARAGDDEDVPCGEYDEWYAFDNVTAIDRIDVFVNGPPVVSQGDGAFWSQMERLAPFAHAADGDTLCVVCRDAEIVAAVAEIMRGF